MSPHRQLLLDKLTYIMHISSDFICYCRQRATAFEGKHLRVVSISSLICSSWASVPPRSILLGSVFCLPCELLSLSPSPLSPSSENAHNAHFQQTMLGNRNP